MSPLSGSDVGMRHGVMIATHNYVVCCPTNILYDNMPEDKSIHFTWNYSVSEFWNYSPKIVKVCI